MKRINAKPVELIVLDIHYNVEELQFDKEELTAKKSKSKSDKRILQQIKKLIENDGKETIKLKFSAYAMQVLDNEFDGYNKAMSDAENKPLLAGSKIIYAGIKGYNYEKGIEEEIIMDDIRRLMCGIDLEVISSLFEQLADASGVSEEEKKKKVPKDHKKKH